MRTLRSVADMRAFSAQARADGGTLGLVPTMGAFHGGHLALMDAAREQCDHVVVSLFVNPAQFDRPDDLASYPRDEARDRLLAARAGVDALFAPPPGEMYPPGFATSIRVDGIADTLEGAVRGAGHFAGVCTVVAKLLNIVTPDVAFFGAKDAQQVAVVRRMARDLDLPVRLAVIATVRDDDGLAMSSRNALLSPAERERAAALPEALRAVQALAAAGEHDPERLREAGHAAMAARGVAPEYLALVDPETFSPVPEASGRVLVVVAARIGATRLIDNILLDASPALAATG